MSYLQPQPCTWFPQLAPWLKLLSNLFCSHCSSPGQSLSLKAVPPTILDLTLPSILPPFLLSFLRNLLRKYWLISEEVHVKFVQLCMTGFPVFYHVINTNKWSELCIISYWINLFIYQFHEPILTKRLSLKIQTLGHRGNEP